MKHKEYDLCVCGAALRVNCPDCGNMIRVKDGKFLTHERCVCTGSHLEYKTCKNSGKPTPKE